MLENVGTRSDAVSELSIVDRQWFDPRWILNFKLQIRNAGVH